jgi:hypothetical protein
MGSNANASYIGSLMCALTYASTYQSKLNSFWSTMMTSLGASYFNESMLILTGLLASGNMPNLKACASSGGCGTDMPPVGGGGSTTQLDKLSRAGDESEEDRRSAATWESWYAYTDENAGEGKDGQAKSSITNSKFPAKDEQDNCKEIQSYEVVKRDGSDWVVKISSYTLNQGTYEYSPFVALGLNAKKNGASGSGSYSLGNCTGFSYEYKGSAHKFKVQTTAIKEGSGEDHFKVIGEASNSSWKAVSVSTGELAQPTWVPTANLKDFESSKIYAFAWELEGDTKTATGISAMTGSLAIKNFKCIGSVTLPTEKPASPCDAGGGSSSSRASSSSGAVSSSSGGGSSSSGAVSSSSRGSSSSTGSVSSSSRGSSSSTGSGSSSSRGSSSSGGGSSSSSSDNTPIFTVKQIQSNNVFFASSDLNLELTNSGVVQIFDLQGNKVLTVNLGSGAHKVSLADLPKGVYFAVVKAASWKQTLKVVR